MSDLLQTLWSADFMPHGHCYLWRPGLVWLQVLSNLAIGLAYVSISVTLAYMVSRIKDTPFQWMYLAFGAFIIACGATHFMDIWTVWTPRYWLDGAIRAVRAVVSVGTAVLLVPLIPKGVALADSARLAHERGLRVEQMNVELKTLYERSKQLEQLKTQFFANVSHELRTPLALILGPVEKLLALPRSEPERQDLELVVRNARMLLKHVNDLLEVTKLEAGKVRPDFAEVDLGVLVRRVASQFEGLARGQGTTFTVEAQGLLAQFDADQIERAILNLLANAFKFTPAGGRIRCTLIQRGGRARLEVADSGPGVPPEQRARVFERFQQGEGDLTRRFGGTGLGLAIAKDFVELHGGSVGIADAPEGGACCFIELPLAAPEGAPVRREAAPSADTSLAVRQALEELHTKVGAIAGATVRPEVLVVEDNPEMLRFVADALSDRYAVATATDGQEALEKAVATPPDLIVSDVMMPRMSGTSSCVPCASARSWRMSRSCSSRLRPTTSCARGCCAMEPRTT